MAKLWAVVDEFGRLWFTRITTEECDSQKVTYANGLLRAAIFCQQDEAEAWAHHNPFRKVGSIYKVVEVEFDGVKLL